MDQLAKQVRRARRRLMWQQYLGSLPACLFVTFLVALLAIVVPKLLTLPVGGMAWSASWLAGAMTVGLSAAAIWCQVKRRSELDAAIEIDRRFELRERVSSALALDAEDLETAAGRALSRDAVRRLQRIDVRKKFPITAGRRAWLPLVPAAMAFAVAFFLPDRGLQEQQAAATPADPAAEQLIKQQAKSLRRKLAERREAADKKGLRETADLFKRLERGTRELEENKDVDRKKAMVKLNDLAKQLEQRRRSLGGVDQLRKQFNQMQDFKQGPADKLGKAIQDGNFQQALKELDKLQQQMQNDELGDQQRQQLAEQMDQMRDKLQQMADAHRQATEQLMQDLEKARQSGDRQRAQELAEQLDRLQQQKPQIDQLRDMAQSLDQASKSMQQGDCKQAAEALKKMSQNLQQLKNQADQMEMLDEAMAQISECKGGMCKPGKQGGKKPGQGGGKKPGREGMQPGMANNQGGGSKPGVGTGAALGEAANDEDNKGTYDSRMKQKVGPGKAVITDFVHGPNIPGQVRESVRDQVDSSRAEAADPLSGKRLPRTHRDHAKEYFEAFRQGK